MNKLGLLKHLKEKGFDTKIVAAFRYVKREDFIPKEFKAQAYEDIALPLGYGQTISQPYTIALMLSLLELKDNQTILEIGSGCGYALALTAYLSNFSTIYGIERISELVEKSKYLLRDHKNIKIINADGSKGLKDKAPFDRILVSASGDEIPKELIKQLKKDGILVMPLKGSIIQLKKISETKNTIKEFPGFAFVPLIKGDY